MDYLRTLFSSDVVLHRILPGVATLVVAGVLGRALGRVASRIVARFPDADISLQRLFGGVVAWAIYVSGLVAALNFFGVNTSGVLAALGAVGLAVGLALKDSLSNIAAGLLLIFERPIKVGDFVQCGTMSGTVEDIGLFATRLRAPDGVCVSAPNSAFWSLPISNFSVNPSRRLDIPVSISYSDSMDAGIRALLDLAATEKRLLPDPAPAAMVSSLDDSAVTLTLRVWVSRQDYWAVRFDLTRAAKLAVEAAGLTIPFPQRVVHIEGKGEE